MGERQRGGAAQGSSHLLPADRRAGQGPDQSRGLLSLHPRGLTPPLPAAPAAPYPQPREPHDPARWAQVRDCPVALLTPVALCAQGLLPRHPHPNPSSLQSQRSRPSGDTSRSKGLGAAGVATPSPSLPAFPASAVLLPCSGKRPSSSLPH